MEMMWRLCGDYVDDVHVDVDVDVEVHVHVHVHVDVEVRSTGDPQFVRVILAPETCNFHRIVIKKLQKRVTPLVLLCRTEKKNMPVLSTNTNILELCVSSLHRGHVQCFKSLTCPHGEQKGPCYSSFKKEEQYVRVILAQWAIQNFSVQKKKCN